MAGQPGPVAILYSHDSLAGSVAPDSQPTLYPDPPLPPANAAARRVAHSRGRRQGDPGRAKAGSDRRQRCAHRPGLRPAAQAGRGGRAAGGDDRRRQGLLCRDPSAGARRLRHLWHRGRQCLRRRGRPGVGRRLEIVAERHRVGEPGTARPGAPDFRADRHRAAQRVVELPGRARAARRRRGGAGPADRGGRLAGNAARRLPSGASPPTASGTAISTTAPISPTTCRSCRSA